MGQLDLLGGLFAVPLHSAYHELVRYETFLPLTRAESQRKSHTTHRFSYKLSEPLLVKAILQILVRCDVQIDQLEVERE